MVEQFKLNFSGEEVQKVKLQEIFLQFEAAKTDAERDKIIKKLDTEFIYGNYHHVKPADVKQSTGKEEMKAESKFDYDKHYEETIILERFHSQETIAMSTTCIDTVCHFTILLGFQTMLYGYLSNTKHLLLVS